MDGLMALCPRCGAGPITHEGADPVFGSMQMVHLTKRQQSILTMVQKGLSNDQIAERLFVSRNTVKFHLKVLYQKLGVKSSRRRVALHALSPMSENDAAGLPVLIVNSSSACSL